MVSDFYIIVKVKLPLILETRNGNKLLKQFVCLSFAAYRAQFCGTVSSFNKHLSVVSDETIFVILSFQRFASYIPDSMSTVPKLSSLF